MFFTFRPDTDMNGKGSLLGVGRFYTRDEALTLLMNMNDFEDESTFESEIEGDSSDSSEYTPEQQYQVRTDSNIQTVLPKETVNQNATKHALLADETATTSGEEHVASPPKVSKAKEIPKKGQKAAPKLVVNQNATKHALLADETATTSGEENVVSPPKVSKAKEIPKKGQKAKPKPVARKRVIPQKAMASNTDLDVEDYYIVEDDNESAFSEYVPCVNYPNDKVYPEDEKNGWVRLDEDTGPPNIYRFEGSCWNYLNLNKYTPGAVFDEFFEDRLWTILSENTKKYDHAKLRHAKDKGDKDPIELLSEGVDQNPCAWLNNWEDTSLDEMKVFIAHLIVMGILKKNCLEQYWKETAFLTCHFLATTCPEIIFKTSCGIFTSVIQMRPTHRGEKKIMILYFWLGQWWTRCKEISVQSTGQEGNFLWMKACVLLRAESISSVITPKSQTGSILNFFMVSEPSTGYICGFEVYVGDASSQSQSNAKELQDASKTSCTVLGLLDSVQLLDMGHHVYFDNYYNSPDWFVVQEKNACMWHSQEKSKVTPFSCHPS